MRKPVRSNRMRLRKMPLRRQSLSLLRKLKSQLKLLLLKPRNLVTRLQQLPKALPRKLVRLKRNLKMPKKRLKELKKKQRKKRRRRRRRRRSEFISDEE